MTLHRRSIALAAVLATCSLPLLVTPPVQAGTGTASTGADACRLERVPDDFAAGFPVHRQALPSEGTLRAALLLVDFSDAPAAQGSLAEAGEHLLPGVTYLETTSGGRLSIEVETTTSWIRMPHPSSAYPFDRGLGWQDHVDYITDAVTAADASVDFSDVDVVWVSATREAPAISFSPTTNYLNLTVDGNRIRHAVTFGYDQWSWGPLVLAHESGHSLGLPDLYLFDPPAGDPGGYHSAVGGWDVMGLISGVGPEMFAWHRWMLGWLEDDQIACVDPATAATVELAPLATLRPDERGAVIMPLSPTRAVVIENRQPLGYDTAVKRGGGLVTVVDTAARAGNGPVRVVDATPGSPSGLDDAAFQVGQTWVEPGTGTEVAFIEGRAGTIGVRVGVEPPTATVDLTVLARCVGTGAVLAVRATNTATVPADVTVTTAYGSRTVAGVAPGRSLAQTFAARAATLPAASVEATGVVDGGGNGGSGGSAGDAAVTTAPYTGVSCG